MSFTYNHKSYLANLDIRNERKKKRQQPDTSLKDIRLYFTYEVPNTYFYLFNFIQVILRVLQQKNFLCPGYSHIYISIGETLEDAIARAYEAIENGLFDIADLDYLDKRLLEEAINQAKEWGIFHEKIIQEKQNKRFRFRISSVPIKDDPEEEIYFTLIDRDETKEYKWKFGKLHLLEVRLWFFKINVTNKLIRTKPRARMEMVLKGRKKELEMSVEGIRNGTGQITITDINVPIEPWILELEEKLKDFLPGNEK